MDAALIERYDKALPRYTSYPPSPVWRSFAADDYGEALRSLDGSFCLYIHVPFCTSKCSICGCNSIATDKKEAISRYTRACTEEIKLISGFIKNEIKIEEVHFGGGTPFKVGRDNLINIMSTIVDSFNISRSAQISIEVDPREMNAQDVGFLAKHSFNRMSIGVQDVDEHVCKLIGRNSPREHISRLVDTARNNKFVGLNVDLIYGLPGQTIESWSRSLDYITSLEPDRIAVFNFAYLPQRMPNQRRIRPDLLPKSSDKIRLFKAAIDHFEDFDYVHIGLDHFARKGDALETAAVSGRLTRTFQGYTDKAGIPVIGVGVTAISEIGSVYAQNDRKLIGYLQKIGAKNFATAKGIVLTNSDAARRHAIREIMCKQQLDIKAFESEFNFVCEKEIPNFFERIFELRADGLIDFDNSKIHVTKLGRLFLRSIANIFDSSLTRAPLTYSRGI